MWLAELGLHLTMQRADTPAYVSLAIVSLLDTLLYQAPDSHPMSPPLVAGSSGFFARVVWRGWQTYLATIPQGSIRVPYMKRATGDHIGALLFMLLLIQQKDIYFYLQHCDYHQ